MEQKFRSKGCFEDEWNIHKKIASNCQVAIVEIGVLNGHTTRILLENSNVNVFGVDPIIPDSMNQEMIGDLSKINSLQIEYSKRFIFIKDFSYNVIKNWNQQFDYIFIDGDHKYEAVRHDFESWIPYLSIDGHVAIHDSAANRGGPHWWDGPSKLADELLNDKRLEYVDTIFSLTLFKKISN